MSQNNKHIENYLSLYCESSFPLNFSVLIKEEWGSGKTYFINKFIDDNEKKIKFIYVSLFGLSKVEEVNEKIFEAFHPILSSKQVKFLSSLAQGAIKFGLKVDLENIIPLDKTFKEEIEKYIDVEVNENALAKNFFSYLKPKKNSEIKSKQHLVFIFDDLERSLINTEEVLSLINNFVERKNLKVILLCNEKEIKDREIFNKFKEKIIGKEFEIVLNFEEAFSEFLDTITQEMVKEQIIKHKELVKSIFNMLEINNLRIISQTFAELNFFTENISDKYLKNEEFVRELFFYFFTFVMYYKKSNSLEELYKLENNENKKGKTSIFREKLEIYSYKVLFGVSFWKKFLRKGHLNKNELEKYIENTSFFRKRVEIKENKEKKYSWEKLLSIIIEKYEEFNEEEFDKLIINLKEEFNECREGIEVPNVLAKALKIILFLKEKNIIDINDQELEDNIERCIKKYKNKLIEHDLNLDFLERQLINVINFNKMFKEVEFERVRNILENLVRKINKEIKIIKNKQEKKERKENLKQLFSFIKKEDYENSEIILKEYEQRPLFTETEINLEISDFSHKSLSLLTKILINRYSNFYYINNQPRYCFYLKELDFWNQFRKKLEDTLNSKELSNLKKLTIESLHANIVNAIQKLEKCKEREIE